MKNFKNQPFFVGYLKMPKQLKKFYRPLIMVIAVFAAVAGYSIAHQQKSSGPAFWNTSETDTLTGLLLLDPYPVLHRIDPETNNAVESILLVAQGKFSADEYAQPFHNKMVAVTGYSIQRGGWTMLEITGDESIVELSENTAGNQLEGLLAEATTDSLGPVTLKGEVADSKCFLGVMKPGIGSVHKACAEVCLLGGIPAMLLVWGDDGQKYGYMLTQPDGSSASKLISKRAADHVEITGELQQKGDLLYIQIAQNGIQSL